MNSDIPWFMSSTRLSCKWRYSAITTLEIVSAFRFKSSTTSGCS